MKPTKIRYPKHRKMSLVVFLRVGFIGLNGAQSQDANTEPIPPVHFHHVHLNVADPERTMGYYIKVHGAVPTRRFC